MTLAKYIRLSSADEDAKYGDKAESNSVSNQRQLLDHYIKTHAEFSGCAVLEFQDDGRSGTNFERPGVRLLLDAARRHEIDCIIVKDFSRFGRNYLEVGSYLEQVFPFLGIRFISVNDGYDSKNHPYGVAGDIGNGIRNLMNELYSRDLSRKVKDSRRQYAKRGQCVSAYPIYGYLKSPEDRRTWVPDQEAAEIIQRIYTMFLEGKGPTEIARVLNESGVPTPARRKRELGCRKQSWNSQRENSYWICSMVSQILRDERYTGKLVAMKTTLTELGNINSAKKLEKEDWVTIPGAFQPIISQETFDTVQELRAKNARPVSTGKMERRLFSRKLKCGYCGSALVRHEIQKGIYYACEGRAWNGTAECKSIRLFEKELISAVLASIRFQAALSKKMEKQFGRQDHKSQMAQARVLADRQRTQMKVEQLIAQKAEIYLRYDSGELPAAEYETQTRKIAAAIEKYKSKLVSDELSPEHGETESSVGCRAQINSLKVLSNLRTLERDVVSRLIRSIHVYAENRIEIMWNFNEDYMRLLAENGEGDGRSIGHL